MAQKQEVKAAYQKGKVACDSLPCWMILYFDIVKVYFVWDISFQWWRGKIKSVIWNNGQRVWGRADRETSGNGIGGPSPMHLFQDGLQLLDPLLKLGGDPDEAVF